MMVAFSIAHSNPRDKSGVNKAMYDNLGGSCAYER